MTRTEWITRVYELAGRRERDPQHPDALTEARWIVKVAGQPSLLTHQPLYPRVAEAREAGRLEEPTWEETR